MARRSSPMTLHFIAPGFQDGEEEASLLNRSIVSIVPAIADQPRDINISSAIEVGHRLAVIGDELNQFYNWRFQNRLVRFARASFYRMVIDVCQSRVMGIFKSVRKWFTRLGKNNLTQRMVAYGGVWVSALAVRNVYHKLTPTVLFAVLSGIIITFELYK